MPAATVLLVDQLTKLWAASALFHFRLLYDAGAAFSTGTGATWVFALAERRRPSSGVDTV